VHRITIEHARWPHHGSQVELATELLGETAHRLALSPEGTLTLAESATDHVILRGAADGTFGSCGDAWMFQFHYEVGMQFYGLGEHSRAFEKADRE